MKLECKLHPTAGQQTVIVQDDPGHPALIMVFCALCNGRLFECLSNVIASTAVTTHGRLIP